MKIEATPEAKKQMAKLMGYRLDETSRYPWWEENILWPVERVWNRITGVREDIEAFWQRGTRGYADRDCWGINWYISSWLPAALRTMINKKKGGGNGYPGWGAANTLQKWHQIVEAIAAGFEADYKLHDGMIDRTSKRGKILVEKRNKGMKLFIKWYDHLWD